MLGLIIGLVIAYVVLSACLLVWNRGSRDVDYMQQRACVTPEAMSPDVIASHDDLDVDVWWDR